MVLIIILSTFRYCLFGFAGFTLLLLTTGLVAGLISASNKDPSPGEYASKAILELLGRIPLSPLAMETKSYSSVESKEVQEVYNPTRDHGSNPLGTLDPPSGSARAVPMRLAKRSAQRAGAELPVHTDPFQFAKLTVKVRNVFHFL